LSDHPAYHCLFVSAHAPVEAKGMKFKDFKVLADKKASNEQDPVKRVWQVIHSLLSFSFMQHLLQLISIAYIKHLYAV
jgi:hypothetical protein